MKEMETPNMSKMAIHSDDYVLLHDFLDWLRSEGVHLGQFEKSRIAFPSMMEITESRDNLLARYFQIDLKALEQERRAVLEAIRQ